MRAIVAYWNDEEALAILKVCRRAIRADAKLLLVEGSELPNEGAPTKFSDLNMLTCWADANALSRSLRTFAVPPTSKVCRIIQAGLFNIIEAKPE